MTILRRVYIPFGRESENQTLTDDVHIILVGSEHVKVVAIQKLQESFQKLMLAKAPQVE